MNLGIAKKKESLRIKLDFTGVYPEAAFRGHTSPKPKPNLVNPKPARTRASLRLQIWSSPAVKVVIQNKICDPLMGEAPAPLNSRK